MNAISPTDPTAAPLPGENGPPMAEPTPLSSPAAPVQESQRITAIDTLRGVALLGILVLNIQSFAMPGSAYMNPTAYGDLSGVNFWVWYLSHLLADQKFMTIFSMLFGAGIVLMTSRLKESHASPIATHYRRMGWLILFGVLHAHLIWYGDILYMYGVCGLVAVWFRNWRPLPLLVVGSMVVLVPFLLWMAMGLTIPYWPEHAVADIAREWRPPDDVILAEIESYQGNWIEQMQQRTPMALMFQTFMLVIWGGWRAGGLMLIGMALFKQGVFSAKRSNRFYLTLVAIAVIIGAPLVMYGIYRNFQEDWSAEYSFFIGTQFNYIGSVLISLGWVGAVMLVFKANILRWLLRALQAVGQMALTNYLMHSIICTFIFYGHGLGLFGEVERTQQFTIVVGIWAMQLILSPLWLRFFQFGPVEWLWRSLTYWRIQPVRRRSGAVPQSTLAITG